MFEIVKEMLAHQYHAALQMMEMCIESCPESNWNTPVGSLTFNQVAFHALFFTDYYLGKNEAEFREQQYHRDHGDFFRTYEELEDRRQELQYDRNGIRDYLSHCRQKMSDALAAETACTLAAPSGFPRREFSRAELHVLNIRHLQHHTAQLSLRLRLDAAVEIPWSGSVST